MLTYKVKTAGQILLVPSDDILPREYSLRSVISSDELATLAHSISVLGMLTPIIVKPVGEGMYRVISGERRRIAAGIAGLRYVPCIIMNVSDEKSHVINIAENMHRRSLHFLEASEAIESLCEFYSKEDICALLSVQQGMLISRVRLLSMPENIRWKIISGNISENAANSICSLQDDRIRNAVVEAMVTDGMSFNDAYKSVMNNSRRSVFTAHYKDYTVFENTIEHAINTMKASGINAETEKTVSDDSIRYTVTINKVVQS